MTRPEGTLKPGQFEEMVEAARLKLLDLLPAENEKDNLAYVLLSVLNNAAEQREIGMMSDHPLARMSNASGVTQCNRVIHDIYYGLVENNIIEPGEAQHVHEPARDVNGTD